MTMTSSLLLKVLLGAIPEGYLRYPDPQDTAFESPPLVVVIATNIQARSRVAAAGGAHARAGACGGQAAGGQQDRGGRAGGVPRGPLLG